MNTPAVLVQDLHKHYGDKHAVDGLDLRVEQGEIFAVLGPNGAGKTTTVEILEGYRKRDPGTVQVLGRTRSTPGACGAAGSGSSCSPPTTTPSSPSREMVRHHAAFYPGSRDADEVIEAVGLADKARTRTRALSGGQRRRLDVALGIIGAPCCSSSTSRPPGSTPRPAAPSGSLIRACARTARPILLTTHYMDEAEHLADRCAVVRDGQVVALDAPSALGARAPASRPPSAGTTARRTSSAPPAPPPS